jgi:hypothetical protein
MSKNISREVNIFGLVEKFTGNQGLRDFRRVEIRPKMLFVLTCISHLAKSKPTRMRWPSRME